MGNVRTEQVKRTAKELIKRYPNMFSGDFEKNKKVVSTLIQGTTVKVRNQIAGYITHSFIQEEEEEETSEETVKETTQTEEGHKGK